MLPGVRFLFAATILAVSVVIFGLGAAAFLRAAHENLASAATSTMTWRPIDAPMARRAEPAPPTLAMLRVDPEPAASVLTAGTIDADAAATRATTEAAPVATPLPENAPAATPLPAASPAAAPQAQADAAPPPEREAPVQAKMEPPASPAETMAAETVTSSADSDVPATVATPPSGNNAPAVASEPVAAPATVAGLASEPMPEPEPAARIASETPAAVEAPPVALTAQDGAGTMPGPATAPGMDTLNAEDRQIKTAMLTEPALSEITPLPAREVKIPVPRIDPSVLDARRKRQIQQQARAARAAKARRIAAIRARAAAQARTAAPDPFGNPSNTFSATPR